MLTKDIHKNIHNGFIQSSQNVDVYLRRLATGEYINKLWYVHTMEYYPAMKRVELIHKSNIRVSKKHKTLLIPTES